MTQGSDCSGNDGNQPCCNEVVHHHWQFARILQNLSKVQIAMRRKQRTENWEVVQTASCGVQKQVGNNLKLNFVVLALILKFTSKARNLSAQTA